MTESFQRYREIIPEFSDFQEALGKPLPKHFRINRLKVESATLIRRFQERGIRVQRSMEKDDTLHVVLSELDSLGKSIEYFLGHIHPQALTSCLPGIALCPKKDSAILDMCAAPGGKTSHLAQLTENSGLIIANEPHKRRQSPLGHTLSRLGVMNAVITSYQAEQFPLKQRFDYVLADVPCSSEGKYRSPGKDAPPREVRQEQKLAELQKKIIVRGFDLLKDDGEMLYVTCTYNPEENECVVHFLLENRDARLIPMHLDLPQDPGILEWKGGRYDRQIRRAIRFYPHRVDSVGFFMAKIGRRK